MIPYSPIDKHLIFHVNFLRIFCIFHRFQEMSLFGKPNYLDFVTGRREMLFSTLKKLLIL